jgi:multiple sugar transport system substrate-binding protein
MVVLTQGHLGLDDFLSSFDAEAETKTIRLLLTGDPFAVAMQNVEAELEAALGWPLEIEVVSYNDARRLTLLNSQDIQSNYDIVSFDIVWLGEYGQQGVLLPLNDYLKQRPHLQTDDFLPIAYQASNYQGQQLGLPISPHPELLWYRSDILAEANLPPPQTTAELLALLPHVHKPEANQYGICWNGQRGQALGQQMAHFYAAFGQPLFDIQGRPTLDTPQAVAAAEYALALQAYSPPDVLGMAWDQRTRRFAQRGCVFTYGWVARTYLVEQSQTSQVQGKVGYVAPPSAFGVEPVTPLGAWSLGIPANIGPRSDKAWQALAFLSSSDVQTLLAFYNHGGMPRTSLLADPDLQARYPAFTVVHHLSEQNQLQTWMRPAVPQWPQLAEILGNVYHDMLLGELTPAEAASEAQKQAEPLFVIE